MWIPLAPLFFFRSATYDVLWPLYKYAIPWQSGRVKLTSSLLLKNLISLSIARSVFLAALLWRGYASAN